MANEIMVGLAILAAAIVTAWFLARRSQKGAKTKDIPCPHCSEKMPRDARACPHCGKEIRVCNTCKAYILEEDGRCEVCGEMVNRPKPLVCQCPKCGERVERRSKKCPKCGEQFWSPIVTQK